MSRVFVSGAFDRALSRQLRFLQEAARLGPVTLLLWPDEAIRTHGGSAVEGPPSAGPVSMGLEERRYYFEALSYVDTVESVSWAGAGAFDPDRLQTRLGDENAMWVVEEGAANQAKRSWCLSRGVELAEINDSALEGFPYEPPSVDEPRESGRKRVVVTGCYDWLHTGHLRFFEEAAAYGELNVIIGSDANVRLLKGEGHPLFSQEERSYLVGSFRAVARCLVSTGSGWLDAEPEIRALGAERYVVNEDGDKAEKRRYCEESGIEYIVLERKPKDGLPRRSSTDLRGF